MRNISSKTIVIFLTVIFLSIFFALSTSPTHAFKEDAWKKLRETGICPTCNLIQGDFRGWQLREANLSGANLERANLSQAKLNKANLFRANLVQALLNGAQMPQANLSGAKLTYNKEN